MEKPRRPRCGGDGGCAVDFANLTPRQGDFFNCMMNAALDSLPTFLQSFMGCLAGGSAATPPDYSPGARDRC